MPADLHSLTSEAENSHAQNNRSSSTARGILLLSIVDLSHKLRTSRSSIYVLMKSYGFPQPIKIGQRWVRWRADEIDKWLDSLSSPR
jgi:predicted DNA-binding transcriptional regulator AlpA